jgi:hypothetical protein
MVPSAVLKQRHSKDLQGDFMKVFVSVRLKAFPKQVVSVRLPAVLNTFCFFLI